MQPSPKQIRSFKESTHRFNVWVGAVRSGKTFSSIVRFIDFLKNGPPGDVMIIGVNRASIQRNVINELYKFLGGNPPPSKSTETRIYGRHVYFVGAHDESAVRAIQGSTLAGAYVDEATRIPSPFWRMLTTRLSVTGSQLFATCNPESPGHWLKKEYIDRGKELDLVSWHFTLEDNPSLDKSIVESLKREHTGVWYKRYILGEWTVAHGLVYDGFDDDNMYTETDSEHYPNVMYYIGGIDYGTTNPTCCLIAGVCPNQWPQIRIEKEYYFDSQKHGRSKTDAELADDIKRFIGYHNLRALYIDPAAASLKLELRNRDLPVQDAKNDVLFGVRVTSKFISGKNMVINRACKNLIEQIQGYQWDEKSSEHGFDKPKKINDHAVDAARYLCATAFPNGDFGHPDENISYDELRRKVYGGDSRYSPFLSQEAYF
jgi:PBSX family phage terminase large subunit